MAKFTIVSGNASEDLAKRIARKSALKRKGKQARITKKAKKTTAKGRKMGLYKNR